jgi:SAM-dependent methyltransferase
MRGHGTLSLSKTIAEWWREARARHSLPQTARQFASKLLEFVRDSTPQRRKQRYGDADYDWEQRVNTTAATVSWRDRLLGQFLSPYQPTEPSLFHEMISALDLDFRQFTFIDVGSGKGRTLLMAADYPFRAVMGVEIVPELHAAAQKNINAYKSDSQRCFAIESHCADARTFNFPSGSLLLYLFNPLPEAGLTKMLSRLEQARREQGGQVLALYHNPELERLFAPGKWKKLGGSHQYSFFAYLPLK